MSLTCAMSSTRRTKMRRMSRSEPRSALRARDVPRSAVRVAEVLLGADVEPGNGSEYIRYHLGVQHRLAGEVMLEDLLADAREAPLAAFDAPLQPGILIARILELSLQGRERRARICELLLELSPRFLLRSELLPCALCLLPRRGDLRGPELPRARCGLELQARLLRPELQLRARTTFLRELPAEALLRLLEAAPSPGGLLLRCAGVALGRTHPRLYMCKLRGARALTLELLPALTLELLTDRAEIPLEPRALLILRALERLPLPVAAAVLLPGLPQEMMELLLRLCRGLLPALEELGVPVASLEREEGLVPV